MRQPSPTPNTNLSEQTVEAFRYVRGAHPARRDLARDRREFVRLAVQRATTGFRARRAPCRRKRLRLSHGRQRRGRTRRCPDTGIARGFTAQTKAALRWTVRLLHHARRLCPVTGLLAFRDGARRFRLLHDHLLRHRQHRRADPRPRRTPRPRHGHLFAGLYWADTVRQPHRGFIGPCNQCLVHRHHRLRNLPDRRVNRYAHHDDETIWSPGQNLNLALFTSPAPVAG